MMQSRQAEEFGSSWSNDRPAQPLTTLGDMLLKVVDLGMVAIVLATALLFGGRHPLGTFTLVAMCGLVSLAWFVRQSIIANATWTRTSAVWIILLALAATVLQVVQLPQEWIVTLSPRLSTLLPLWSDNTNSGLSFGSWQTLSVAPHETRLALATLVAYCLLFLTAAQRIQSTDDVVRIVRLIGIVAVCMAVFGVVQYLMSNGKFYWFFDYPYTNTTDAVKGSFTNRNHFAHYLVLGLGPLVALFIGLRIENRTLKKHSWSSSQVGDHKIPLGSYVFGLLSLIVIGATLFSRSRGGAMTLTFALVLLTGIYLRMRLARLSDVALLSSLGVLAVIAMVSMYGYDDVAERLDDFAAGSLEELDSGEGRRRIWQANLESIRSGWQTGSGTGTHRYVYPAYLTEPDGEEYTHAENGYLQIITENGLSGAVLLCLVFLCGVTWCINALRKAESRQERLLAGVVTTSLTASLVHSFVDFVWFVPACVVVTILLSACALRLSQLTGPDQQTARTTVVFGRPAWAIMALFVLAAGAWASAELLGPARASIHWDRYQRSALAHKTVASKLLLEAGVTNPDLDQADEDLTRFMIQELGQVTHLEPQFGRAHLKLATNLLRMFERRQSDSANQMTIAQIRDAAIASQFSNANQLQEWLTRAFGQQSNLLYRALHHTKLAIELCPLQGDAYTLMGQLCFLEGHGIDAVEACFQQAETVTPMDSDVLFATGVHQLSAGRTEEAFESWTPLFQTPIEHQHEVANLLAGRIPAAVFLQGLRPTISSLPYLWRTYRQRGNEQDWLAIETHVRQLISQQSKDQDSRVASRHWTLLARVERELSNNMSALASYQQAHQLNPNDFALRYEMAIVLSDLQEYEKAESHLRWCQTRCPEHGGVERQLKNLSKLRLTQAGSPLRQ